MKHLNWQRSDEIERLTTRMKENQNAQWEHALALISENVSEQQYNTWFKTIVFESFTESTNTVLVQVPSPFVYEYLEENYVDLLSKVLRRAFCDGVRLAYRVVTDREHRLTQRFEGKEPEVAVQPKRRANESPTVLDAMVPQELDPQLNGEMTFSTFIEGDSNKLPRSVGQSIAQNPQTTQFNPLFIYGPSGCGKTHLVNAIGMRTKELHPEKRVLYLSAHLFMVQFTDARKNNVFNDFMHFYQSIDMLIVDDVQELAGMTATQNAFFHIFNHLRQNGKQIIMTCDRPPVSLQGMEERLITRFKSGLMAEMEKPEETLRRSILHSIVKHDGLTIPDEVLNYISRNVTGSVRELEGIIHSLLAYSVVYSKDIDLEFAQRILAGRIKVEKKEVTIDQIITCTCELYNVKEEEVFGKSRKAKIVTVRQVSMYLAHKHTKLTTSKIGIYVGNRDHATVLHGIKTIDGRLKVDKELQKALEELESRLIGKTL